MKSPNLQPEDNFAMLVPPPTKDNARTYKDTKNRLTVFAAWLSDTDRRWDTPDLLDYRQHLLEDRRFAPLTVNAHLSTIRVRYRALLNDGTIRAALERTLLNHLTPTEIEGELEYRIRYLWEEIDPKATQLDAKAPELDYLRLTQLDVMRLLRLPNLDTLTGLRDRAILAMFVGTGTRAPELCALDVSDLRHDFEGEEALNIRPGTGCTERLVPYGGMSWVLRHVDEWLQAANISEGPVFRRFFKGGRPRMTRLTTRALDKILACYPLEIDDQKVTMRPMDLRRTYARLLYDAGVNPVAIQANLGLKDSNAVLDYIGEVHPSQRVPPRFEGFG